MIFIRKHELVINISRYENVISVTVYGTKLVNDTGDRAILDFIIVCY